METTMAIMDLMRSPEAELIESALGEWRKRQTSLRGSVSIDKFSEMLGYSRPLVSMWMSDERPITYEARMKIVKPIADLMGAIAYDTLGVPPSDPFLSFITRATPRLNESQKKRVEEQIANYLAENENQTTN